MTINRRRFLLSSLASAVTAPQLFSMQRPHGSLFSLKPSEKEKAYGSGHFGEWIDDAFGLPAFRYTCNQTTDPKARTPVTPDILTSTEHVHQVGNDRITAIASNYGHVRVRQDEGCPKFLNDYAPETSQFAGGLGYLTDSHETLSTYYGGNHSSFERTFGVGYFRKKVSGKNWSVDQVISAPFGDDPVLLSQVTIANHGASSASARWVEYWGCQPYEFSFRSYIESVNGMGSAPELRRRAGQRFQHRVRSLSGMRGLLETRHFPGYSAEEDAAWQRIRANLVAHPNNYIAPVRNPEPGTWIESADAPPTFLVALDGPASGFSTDGKTFFGTGGPSNPGGLNRPLDGNLASAGPHTALLLERTVHLNPGEERTLYFMYGYLPAGFDVDTLMTRYEPHAATAWRESSAQWKQYGMRLKVDAEPWVDREAAWNHYYLRSSLTYDDFFGEHILNQNGYYQYVMGFQGAARDPLQHCLPFLFSDPEIVRSVLRYTLKEVRDNGSVPYAIVGHGVVAPMVQDNASDLPLWLLWAVSEYVLATRDLDFLNEEIPARTDGGARVHRTDTVRNLLARCYRYQADSVGVGEHGIVRMLVDDWNDGLLSTWAQSTFRESVKVGESVLNSAMSAWVFDKYARLLSYAGGSPDLQEQVKQTAEADRQATRKQWTGKWLKRAWLDPSVGWLGETTLWLEPQPWGILAGVTSPAQSRELAQTMNRLLRHGPLGASQMSPGPDMTKPGAYKPWTSVRGGIWPSLNQTLIWALATVDPAMAWDEWKRNSFAAHAEAYPNVWYGVWSGPDTYNASLSQYPGETIHAPFFHCIDFPVLNLHSHACFLYSATKLLGIEFTEEGVTLRPWLPESYRFESPLLGVAKSAEGHYEGWYAPSHPGNWTVRILLPAEEAKKVTRADINGVSVVPSKLPDGAIELTGSSESKKPLRWKLS